MSGANNNNNNIERSSHHQRESPYKNMSLAKSVDHLLASFTNTQDSAPPLQLPQQQQNTQQQSNKDLTNLLACNAKQMTLSKSIKDLRLFVSNSFSPSLIIRPPPPDYVSENIKEQEEEIPVKQPIKQQQAYTPRRYTKSNEQSRVIKSPTRLGRDQNNDEALIDCILDMKPMSSNSNRYQQQQRQQYKSTNYENHQNISHNSRQPKQRHQAQQQVRTQQLPTAQQVFPRKTSNNSSNQQQQQQQIKKDHHYHYYQHKHFPTNHLQQYQHTTRPHASPFSIDSRRITKETNL